MIIQYTFELVERNLSCGMSTISPVSEALKRHSNDVDPTGFDTTSHEIRTVSSRATPNTCVWSGLQYGASFKRKVR